MMTQQGTEKRRSRRAIAIERTEREQERKLERLPFAFQTRAPGCDWVTLAKSDGTDFLQEMAGNRPDVDRRVLNRNTIVATWAAGEKAGDQ